MVKRVSFLNSNFSEVNNPKGDPKGKQSYVKHADSTWLGRKIQVKTIYCQQTLHLNRGSLINYINAKLHENEPKLRKSWLGLGLCGGASKKEIQDKLNDVLARQIVHGLQKKGKEIDIKACAEAMKKNIEAYIKNLEPDDNTGKIQWKIISSQKDGNSLQLQLIFPDEETKKKVMNQEANKDSYLAPLQLEEWQTKTKRIITLASRDTFSTAQTENVVGQNIGGSWIGAIFDQAMRAIQKMKKQPPEAPEDN